MYPATRSGARAFTSDSSVTDEFERLLDAYQQRASASVKSKLAVLMNVERIRGRRVVPFLLQILRDGHESEEVRIYVLKRLRSGNGLLVGTDRPPVATAIGDVLTDNSTPELRLQTALALGEFTDIDGVLRCLSAICLKHDESIDLRYAAFTSLERAGPTPECVVILRQISNDETLGNSARSVLSAWHIA